MARKRSSNLTDGEHRIMEVLWQRGPSTVAEVCEALEGEEGTAYSTVMTLMRIMYEKGYLAVKKSGRAFIYEPVINRQTAARTAVKQVLAKFFDDSPGELVLNFLRHEDLAVEELDALKRQILAMEDDRDARAVIEARKSKGRATKNRKCRK